MDQLIRKGRIPKPAGLGEGGFWTKCEKCRIQDDNYQFFFHAICEHREWCEVWLAAKTEAAKGDAKTGGQAKTAEA